MNKHDVYVVGVKTLARVGWWMQRPLIRLQQEMLEHPMDVSDEEVEEFLHTVRGPRSTDTPVSQCDNPMPHDPHGRCEGRTHPMQPRTLDVSTEEIKSWPKIRLSPEPPQWYREAFLEQRRLEQEEVRRIRQADLEQDRAPGTAWSERLEQIAAQARLEQQFIWQPGTPGEHGLRTIERITEPSHSKDWGPLVRFVAHCQCGWDSGQCYPREVATQAHTDHRARHNDDADYASD